MIPGLGPSLLWTKLEQAPGIPEPAIDLPCGKGAQSLFLPGTVYHMARVQLVVLVKFTSDHFIYKVVQCCH